MINNDTRLLRLTCILQRQFELGRGNDDRLGNYGFHAPRNHFDFQRMDDKVKDGLVLSIIWCLERHLEYFRTLFFLWPYY